MWIRYKVAKQLSWLFKVRRKASVIQMDWNTRQCETPAAPKPKGRSGKVPFQNVTNLQRRRSDTCPKIVTSVSQVPTVLVEGAKVTDYVSQAEVNSPLRDCFRVPENLTPKSLVLLRQGSSSQCGGQGMSSRKRRSTVQSPGFVDVRRYEIISLLGAGGFGRVYKAVYKGKLYAVKKMHSCTKNHKASLESHQAEQVAMKLRHPHVVRTLATSGFDHPGGAIIVMEYVGDQNLQQVIFDQSVDFPLEKCIKFALHISDALEYVHRNHIIHLDLKPANIIVSSEDLCKLADFGCCRLVDSNSLSDSNNHRSHLTGTFAYRAPELLRGESPTRAADIYSLGITMWQMLSRELPYSGDPHAIIFAVVAYNLRPTVPPTSGDLQKSYNQLYGDCWAASPSNRPSAFEVCGSLRKLRGRLKESV